MSSVTGLYCETRTQHVGVDTHIYVHVCTKTQIQRSVCIWIKRQRLTCRYEHILCTQLDTHM